MSEQQIEAQQESTEQNDGGQSQGTPEIDSSAVRKHQLFKEVTGRQKEELKAVKAELAALREADKKRAAELEASKAQEEGRLKELYASREAEFQSRIEALEAERKRDSVRHELVLAAAQKGITNPITQKGLLAEYETLDGEDKKAPAEWLSSLEQNEQFASLFAPQKAPPIGAGVGGKAASRVSDKGSLMERLKDPKDVEAFEEARRRHARGEPLD